MEIRPAKKQQLGQIMSLKDFMAKKRAAEERKEKRQAKSLYLWPNYRRVAARGKVKTPRQKLRDKIDELMSVLVRRRDSKKTGGLCVICLNRPIDCCYHIISKQCGDAIRWDLDDCVASCFRCNYAEMRNRNRYRRIHIKLFGREKIEALEAKAATTVHFSMADLEAIRADLTRRIQTGQYE